MIAVACVALVVAVAGLGVAAYVIVRFTRMFSQVFNAAVADGPADFARRQRSTAKTEREVFEDKRLAAAYDPHAEAAAVISGMEGKAVETQRVPIPSGLDGM